MALGGLLGERVSKTISLYDRQPVPKRDRAPSNVDLNVVDEEKLNYIEVPKLNSMPSHRNKSAQKVRVSPGQVDQATIDASKKDVAVKQARKTSPRPSGLQDQITLAVEERKQGI